MSGYLLFHVPTETCTIVTGSLPLAVNAPQGGGTYRVYELGLPFDIVVAATVTAPSTMAAPTLTGGETQITIAPPSAPNLNGGTLLTDGYRFLVYSAADALLATVDRGNLAEFNVTGLSAQTGVYATVFARTNNGNGAASAASNTVAVTAAETATAPDAFLTNGWALTDKPSADGDTLTLTISALPVDNGGAAITSIQYRIGTGAAVTLASGAATGARDITVLADTEASIEVRAVNSVGAGPWSAAKTATPTVVTASLAGSLRFPDTNGHTAATNLVLRQSTTNMPAPLAADTAFFGIIELPSVVRNEEEIYTILGDGFGGDEFTIAVYGRGPNLGERRNTVTCFANDTIVSSVLPTTLERFLLVAERQANNVRVGVYPCDGSTSLPGTFKSAVSGTTGAYAWTGTEFRIGDFGSDGTAPAATFLPVSKQRRFPGEIALLGYVDGTATQANWESIAAGADPITVLGAANLPWYRRFDGTTETLDHPSAATADSTSAATVFGTMLKGGHIVAQSEAKSLLVNPLPLPGQVYGVKKAVNWASAQVPLSGTAAGRNGETIEARILYEGTNNLLLDWTVVGNVASGAWTGTVTCPRSANGWCYVEVRSQSEPAAVATRMQPFAAGYKLVMLGQSQVTIAMNGTGFGSTVTTPLKLTYASVLENAPGVSPLKAGRVGGDYVSDALAELSNTLGLYSNDTPIMVIRESVNGTRVDQFLDDGQAGRTFDTIVASVAAVGGDVSIVLHQWGTSDAGEPDYGDLHDELNAATPVAPIDHSLPQALDAGYEYLVMPLSRHSNNYMNNIRQTSIAWAQANSNPFGPWFSDVTIDEGGGTTGAHQNISVLMGNPNWGAKAGIGVARAVGIDTSTNPYFAQGVELSSDRTKITVTPVLPNGGTLYSPAPTNLSQFFVSENGGSSYATDGFIAAIADGKVEITKDSAGTFATGSMVSVRSDNRNFESGVWSEADITAGVLYESYDKDRMNRGLMIMGGRDSDGNYITNYVSDAATLQGAAVPGSSLPTGVTYKGSFNSVSTPYTVSATSQNTSNPVSWITPADGTIAWVSVLMQDRKDGNPLPPSPAILETRNGISGTPTNMTLFGSDGNVFINGPGTARAIMAMQYQTPASGAGLMRSGFGSASYWNLSHWEVDPAVFDLTATQSVEAVNAGVASTSVEIANVPAGSVLFAAAYNRDGTPITFNGGTVNHMDTRTYGSSARRVSVMSGTASGNLTVTATAEMLLVGIIPPN